MSDFTNLATNLIPLTLGLVVAALGWTRRAAALLWISGGLLAYASFTTNELTGIVPTAVALLAALVSLQGVSVIMGAKT